MTEKEILQDAVLRYASLRRGVRKEEKRRSCGECISPPVPPHASFCFSQHL